MIWIDAANDDYDRLERVHDLLHDFGEGQVFYKAYWYALQRAATTINQEAAVEVQKTYTVKQTDFKKAHRSKISVRGDSKWSEGITAKIQFAGHLIPLYDFDVTPRYPGTKRKVQARVLKSSTKTQLENAYIATFKARKPPTGVFERKYPWRDSSFEIYGPSAAHMIGNDEVREKIIDKGIETLDKRLEHEISRILNGR